MNKVAIFSDSTIDLNKEDYEHYSIHVIPLFVEMDGKTYQDGVDITSDQIYESVQKNGKLPATAAIGPDRLAEIYKPYIDKGYDIVFVGIGADLSGTVQASHIASQEFPEGRIYTVDSRNLSSASGILAMEGAKMAQKGESAEAIYKALSELALHVSAQFGVERLDFLQKGGRCSNLVAVMGHLLHIHPIMKVIDGKLIVYKKPRGKSRAFYDELVKIAKEEKPDQTKAVMLTHGGTDQKNIDYIIEKLSKFIDPKCIKVSRCGAVISSHCGYGTIGLLYVKTKE